MGLNFEVFGWSAEFAVEFVFGVKPFFGEAFGDGMFCIEVLDEERSSGTVGAAFTFCGDIANDFSVDDVHPCSVFDKFTTAPSSDTDHFVILFPFSE